MSKKKSKRSTVNDSVEIRDLKPAQWYKLRNPLRISITILVFMFISSYLPPQLKRVIYKLFGVDIGKGTVVSMGAVIDPFYPDKIKIGENTVIGWHTKVLTHEVYPDEWHIGPVEIGDNVTLGHSSSIRPGITIEDNATIAAHSFVNRDVKKGEKVAGTPIKTL